MELVNLTPHPIVLMNEQDEVVLTVPASGTVARCQFQREIAGTIRIEETEIPVNHAVTGELEGLPNPQPETIYIVSKITAEAARTWGRDDVYIVDETVRDSTGRIIGCRALAQL